MQPIIRTPWFCCTVFVMYKNDTEKVSLLFLTTFFRDTIHFNLAPSTSLYTILFLYYVLLEPISNPDLTLDHVKTGLQEAKALADQHMLAHLMCLYLVGAPLYRSLAENGFGNSLALSGAENRENALWTTIIYPLPWVTV